MTTSIRIRITGRVQGVSYRAWTVKRAQARGIEGWVRNREDGTVEAILKGEQEEVRAMIEECRKGPLLARVDDIQEEEARGVVEVGFRQMPTV